MEENEDTSFILSNLVWHWSKHPKSKEECIQNQTKNLMSKVNYIKNQTEQFDYSCVKRFISIITVSSYEVYKRLCTILSGLVTSSYYCYKSIYIYIIGIILWNLIVGCSGDTLNSITGYPSRIQMNSRENTSNIWMNSTGEIRCIWNEETVYDHKKVSDTFWNCVLASRSDYVGYVLLQLSLQLCPKMKSGRLMCKNMEEEKSNFTAEITMEEWIDGTTSEAETTTHDPGKSKTNHAVEVNPLVIVFGTMCCILFAGLVAVAIFWLCLRQSRKRRQGAGHLDPNENGALRIWDA